MKYPRLIAVAALVTLTPTFALAIPAAPLAEPDSTQKQAMDMAFNISDAFEYAAEKIEPSVVHITVRNSARSNPRNPHAGEGLGSGVIVDPRGYILTNNHVVEAGRYITVRLADGRELGARLVGTFAETDIAVLKIEADDIVAASFTDSEAARVGQWVLAVGSPFGFEQTVTAGIISAKGRGSANLQLSQGRGQKLQEFIQTDAAINPGNSGGPLVDLHGDIIGINTAIISRTGSNNGLGFAIPADIAKAVMEQIIETGRVERGWLGINMLPLSPMLAHELDIEGGVVIKEIVGDGPAKQAGLIAGDIITAVGGRTTENIVRLSNAIMLTKPDEPVEIEFIRDAEPMKATATVSNRDEEIRIAQRSTTQRPADQGVYIQTIGAKVLPRVLKRERSRRRTETLPGFLVAQIERNSPAELRGLEVGDFIFQIDGQIFDSAFEIEDYLRGLPDKEPIRIRFYRGTQPMYVDLIPASED